MVDLRVLIKFLPKVPFELCPDLAGSRVLFARRGTRVGYEKVLAVAVAGLDDELAAGGDMANAATL